MVSKGDKTDADAARLFKIHPATVRRVLARTPPSARTTKHAKLMLTEVRNLILKVTHERRLVFWWCKCTSRTF